MTLGDKQPAKFEKGQALTAAAMNRLVDAVVAQLRRMFGARVVQPLNMVIVFNEDAAGPATSLAAASAVDFYELRTLADGTREIFGAVQTAYIDDPDFSVERGTLGRVEWIQSRWMVYYASCAPDPALITALDAL